MADKIQNIVVNYVANTQGLDELIAKTSKLTKEEKDLANSFDKANKEASELENEAKKIGPTIENSTNKGKQSLSVFEQGVKKVGTAIIAAFAFSQVVSFGNQVVQVTAEFQKLSAVLTNTLGSSSMAQRALTDIQEFASVTPYGVAELTQSFVKLANQGFAPTTEELRKLGDLASSTGKGFDQLTEAIIDAQTGEFERLKEFGIRASKEGDKVSFTFKGVKTQTDFTNDSIRAYILSLGDLEGVSGSMAAISDTLGGAISNLGDSYTTMLNVIGDGNKGILKDAVSLLNQTLQGITTALLTEEQIADKALQKAAQVKGANILRYIDEDTKTLLDTNTELNGVLLTQNQIYEINIGDLKATIDEENQIIATIDKKILALEAENEKYLYGDKARNVRIENLKKERFEEQKAIAGQQFAIDTLTTRIQANEKAETAASEAAAKAAALRKIEAEKAFKAAIDLLRAQEELAIRRGKLNGQSEAELNMVSQYYNDLRVDIYKRYGKAVGVVFEGVKLRGEELEKEYTDIVVKEVQERIKKRKDAELSALDQSYAEEKLQATNFYNGQLKSLDEQLLSRKISVQQYQEQVYAIEKEYGNKSITDQIDILEVKKNVKGQEASEITKINQEIADLEAKLRDDGVSAFIDSEKKKTDEAKKAAEQRKQILNEGFQLSVDLLNGFAQLEKNNSDVRLADSRSKRAQELKDAGDNEQAKAVINAKYAKQEADIKRRQAQADKEIAIFNIILSTAQAVIKAFAQAGPVAGIPLAAFAAASGALQLGLVASKPIPQYNKGVKRVPGKDMGYDTEISMLRPGEMVVSKETTDAYNPALNAIFDRKIPASVLNGMVMNYGKLTPMIQSSKEDNTEIYLKQMISKMDKLQQVHITADKNGIKSWVREGDTETEFVNRYFRN